VEAGRVSSATRSEWLLFVHIASAFIFFGGVLTVAIAGTVASRAAQPAVLERLAQRVHFLLVWPSLVILVAAGARLASEEDVYGRGWLRFGVGVAAVAVVLAALEVYLARSRGERSPAARILVGVALVLLVVVFWAMSAKPGAGGL
jgi:hypothetical protein